MLPNVANCMDFTNATCTSPEDTSPEDDPTMDPKPALEDVQTPAVESEPKHLETKDSEPKIMEIKDSKPKDSEPKHSEPEDPEPAWERVLWKKQNNLPDNFIGRDFFRVTKRRLDVGALECLAGSLPVSREIACCFLLVAAFQGLSSRELAPGHLLVSVAFYIAFDVLSSQRSLALAGSALPCLLVGCLCACLVSVVQSLTASVATDTVHACACALLCLHVLLYDYGCGVSLANATLSHNVGVFACVCLASRLEAYWNVFAFSLTGIALFATRKEATPSNLAPILPILASGLSLRLYAPSLLPLFLGAVGAANLAMPLLYWALQEYRMNIYGPWDEAHVEK